MEMGLRVLGRGTVAVGALQRLLNYVLLVAGGAVGGAVVAGGLSALGRLVRLPSIGPYPAAVLLVALAVLTIRQPSREWGLHRQVGRTSSFGVSRPRPRAFLWGTELGSGVATVITQSSTIGVMMIALVVSVPLALLVGAVYGATRLAGTWRGSFPRRGEEFAAAMGRYGSNRARVTVLNLVFVLAAAAASIVDVVRDVY